MILPCVHLPISVPPQEDALTAQDSLLLALIQIIVLKVFAKTAQLTQVYVQHLMSARMGTVETVQQILPYAEPQESAIKKEFVKPQPAWTMVIVLQDQLVMMEFVSKHHLIGTSCWTDLE